ncbi:hypothetical protein VNO77_20449 [Canavalia gladiata]|uniref:Uncharacterized protein n=1 Tax=Canavalia gladiata TaxID=3824 RepID=A0AAN9QLF8_CANGL
MVPCCGDQKEIIWLFAEATEAYLLVFAGNGHVGLATIDARYKSNEEEGGCRGHRVVEVFFLSKKGGASENFSGREENRIFKGGKKQTNRRGREDKKNQAPPVDESTASLRFRIQDSYRGRLGIMVPGHHSPSPCVRIPPTTIPVKCPIFPVY